jgi:exopolysaccharide biosynthesis polyprenyl glycosylphosphotransferase
MPLSGTTTRESLIAVGDIVALFGALFIGSFINKVIDATSPGFPELASAYIPLFAVWILIAYVCELYSVFDLSRNILLLKRIGAATALMAVAGITYFYVLPITGLTPRSDLVVITACAAILMFLWRYVLGHVFRRTFQSGALILGTHPIAGDLLELLTWRPHLGLAPVFHVATIEQADALLQQNPRITTIILANLPSGNSDELLTYVRNGYRVLDLGEAYELYLSRIPVQFVDATWIMHKVKRGSTLIGTIVEETLGRILALIVLIAFLWVILIIVIAIKIEDGGPIFYKQARVGKFGKLFMLYKFRSMRLDAEKNGARWAQENDPSVTRVGRITRKTHVDEIAQMWNVLRGDITLVGPRPERPEFVEQLEMQIPHYSLRHIVKPGFTGWAQIKFRYARSVMDSQEKFEYDLFYIKNKNLLLDLGIIVKTIQIIVSH